MDPLIIEHILRTPDLPGDFCRGGLKVVAKPSDKIVLCAIARCQKSQTDMRSGVKDQVTKGKPGEGLLQKKICDLLELCEDKITVAMIARLSGYSWNRAKAIVERLKRLKVISDDYRIMGYGHDYYC